MSKGISIEDLKQMGVGIPPEENIQNINISRTQPVDQPKEPVVQKELSTEEIAKMMGLKSQRQLDQENPDLVVPEEKVYDDFDKAIMNKIEEVQKVQESFDMVENEELTKEEFKEAVAEAVGFNPYEMLEDPPMPGRIKNNKIELPEEEKNKILEASNKQTSTPVEEIKYDNDDIDEDELLEKEILENIPEVDEVPVRVVPNTAPTVVNDVDLDKPVNNSDVIPKVSNEKIETERSEDDDLAELLGEDDGESEEDDINAKRLEILKDDVQKKIKPTSNDIDIRGFTISNKPISINNAINQAEMQSGRIVDWPLLGSNRICSMKEFKGKDIETLVQNVRGRNKANSIRQQYQLIYDHIVDPYKPQDVEAWAKTTSILDVDQLYACIYLSSFEGRNYLPYDCPDTGCNNSFLTESIPFMDMVKFKNDEVKEKFYKILNSEPNPKHETYESKLIPISDCYAMEFKEPTIYDVVFISSYLDDEFINKYNDIVALAPYIDGIYYIDMADKTLRPVNIKKFVNDKVKTAKAKIITLSKIVKELTSDQFNMMATYANSMTNDVNDGVTFIMPEVHCPKCGTKIEERTYSAAELLFLRHHLTALLNG